MDRPGIIEADVPLAGFATIRTGGSAELFARPESGEQVAELLAWADGRSLPVAVIGSGSNLLIADAGVGGLVIKLGSALSGVEFRGEQAICGAAARLPSVAAAAARAGLAGIEFGVSIPGTVGGAVCMNAGAYGGELAAVLAWAEIAAPGLLSRRTPEELGFGYRRSLLQPGREVVTAAAFNLRGGDPEELVATMRQLRERRHDAQPSGIKTFGSTFKNPEPQQSAGRSAGQLLSEADCNGFGIGGARFSPKHANFIENTGMATSAEVLELMAAGRDRVRKRFGIELEPEVQTLGELRFPW